MRQSTGTRRPAWERAVTWMSGGALVLAGVGAVNAGRADAADAGVIHSVAGATVDGRQYGFSGDGGPATSAQLYHPRDVAFDRSGNVFVADTLNQRIRRIDTSGTITTVAGSGVEGYAGDGGPARSAQFNQPHGVAVDRSGNLYVADSGNNRIRRVDTRGVITTIAGTGVPGAAGDDGPAHAAQVKDPKALAMAGERLYIADTGNNRVRVIDLDTGVITTVAGVTRAGADGDGGPAERAALNSPRGVAVAGGEVYIADTDNHRIRKVDDSGEISTVAGTGTPGWSGDRGRATRADLHDPRAVAVDRAGNIYIGEELGQRVRRVDPDGVITTIAGNGMAGFAGDGGPAARAQFDHMRAISLDGAGNLWVADTFNNRVRVITDAASAPGGATPPPSTPPTTAKPAPPPPPRRSGYWMVGSDGRVFAFGDARPSGDAVGALPDGARVVDIAPTPAGEGYWVLDNRGNVYPFGDGDDLGPPSEAFRKGEKATSLSALPSGDGYWIFTNRGRAYPVGKAPHLGDMGGVDLNGPVLSSVATPSGQGYYMVASDGGVFTFGDAAFRGSMGGVRLNQPVQGLVPTFGGAGYWLVAADGGVFSFGDAAFRGSMGGVPLNQPVVGMVRYGDGYLMVAADGGIFNFSDRPFAGSLGDNPPERPIVAVAPLD